MLSSTFSPAMFDDERAGIPGIFYKTVIRYDTDVKNQLYVDIHFSPSEL